MDTLSELSLTYQHHWSTLHENSALTISYGLFERGVRKIEMCTCFISYYQAASNND